MKISNEIRQWLKDNAWALKGEDAYSLPDFPKDQVPDKLVIPIRKRGWITIINRE